MYEKIILTALVAIASLIHCLGAKPGAQLKMEFTESFTNPKGVRVDSSLVLPPLQHFNLNFRRAEIAKGVKATYIRPVMMGGLERVSTLLSYKYPDVYFVVLDYDGIGYYYGFAQIRGVQPKWENLELLVGHFTKPNGDTIPVAGNLDCCLNPKKIAGTYRSYQNDWASTYDYFEKTADGGVEVVPYVGIFTFNKNGTGSLKYGREFTEDTSQSDAGSYTSIKNGKFVDNNVLTGGWPFDVDAKATMPTKWNLTDGVLSVKVTGKPTFSVTTKLNTDKIIDGWKQEYEQRSMDFTMSTYHRQYLAQCKSDYPNFMVKNVKAIVLKDLKETCTLPNDMAMSVIGVGDNDIYALPKNSDNILKLIQFQKKDGETTRINRADLRKYFDVYSQQLWPQIVKDMADSRKEMVISLGASAFPGNELISMVASDLSPDLSQAKVVGLVTEEGKDRPTCYVGNLLFRYLPLDGKKNYELLNPYGSKKTLKEDESLKQLETEIAENEALLERMATEKQFKKASKPANNYLKRTKGQPRVWKDYTTVAEYWQAVDAAREMRDTQLRYIQDCTNKLEGKK